MVGARGGLILNWLQCTLAMVSERVISPTFDQKTNNVQATTTTTSDNYFAL